MTEHKEAPKSGASKGQSVKVRHCDMCGAAVPPCSEAQERWGQVVWLCELCERTLTADEVESLAHELALRGVPYS